MNGSEWIAGTGLGEERIHDWREKREGSLQKGKQIITNTEGREEKCKTTPRMEKKN